MLVMDLAASHAKQGSDLSKKRASRMSSAGGTSHRSFSAYEIPGWWHGSSGTSHVGDDLAWLRPCLRAPGRRTRTDQAFVLERSPVRRGVEAGHPELQRAQDDARGIVWCRRPPSVVVLACRWRTAELRGHRNVA